MAGPRIGVVLLNLGGPERLEDVEQYLFNIFNDPYILDFPWPLAWLRKPLARRIARKRAPESRENYRKIGGGSPLNRRTMEQAQALEAELKRRGHDARVTFAQRAWTPRAETAARQLREAGVERGVMLPLYPQFARATTKNAFEDFEEAWSRVGSPEVSWTRVRSFPDHPGYVEAVAADIRRTLGTLQGADPARVALYFSAHGLPLRQVAHPEETYPAEVRATVEAVLRALDWKGRHHLGYQSRVGPVKWLEPYPEQVIERMVAEGTTDAVVYPVAFVSDHSETLYELDMQYGDIARAKELRWHRVEALNERPAFIEALADLVEGAAGGEASSGLPLQRRKPG